MTLLVKFKPGKLQKYENVDDTELDDGYLYVTVKYYVVIPVP